MTKRGRGRREEAIWKPRNRLQGLAAAAAVALAPGAFNREGGGGGWLVRVRLCAIFVFSPAFAFSLYLSE